MTLLTQITALVLLSFSSNVEGIAIYDYQLNGTVPYEGTVEVLTYQGWVGLCSDYWGSSESQVLCRQLGYDYSRYTSTLSMSDLQYDVSFSCTGNEKELSQCPHSFDEEYTHYYCFLPMVYCAPCTNGRVRLLYGVVPEAGTVEYCVDGQWKAVCDNSWDDKDAFVVCRQLGYPATDAVPYLNSYFGNHPIPSGLYFNCFGNESSLSSCQNRSHSSCNSETDAAGVHCRGYVITEFCTGHLRLAGGRDVYEGRVEICRNGLWGTIYDGGWDGRDAQVVCRQLGLYQPYSRVEVFYNSYFGRGSGPVLYLNCDGTETTIDDCSTHSYYFGASHSDDAGVRCNRATTTVQSPCANGDVRLANGSTPHEGRVEMCYNRVWGSICDSGWNDRDAAILCHQLGFQGTNVTALTGSYFGSGTGPYLLYAHCRGEESSLLQCGTIGYHRCSSNRDAGVRCDALTCNHGDVRLFGGYTESVGVAEVCINGLWGDICDEVTDQTTLARLFCRQFIGQELPSYVVSSCCSGARQRNSGNITLYDVSCVDRSRTFIQDCSYHLVSGYSTDGCSLREELIIGCYEQSSCTSGDIRLANGSSALEGRVELCSQGMWGSIAASSWDYTDARVVCRQLGYPWEWAIETYNDLFGRGRARNIARNVHCSTSDQHFNDCSYTSITSTSGMSYESYDTAGVICQGNTSAPIQCEHGDVRLVNGTHTAEGRVEVCADGYWATACYNGWDIVETEVVCKQLNLPSEGSTYLSDSPFGSNYHLPIVRVSCGSGDNNISECQIYTDRFTTNCNHRLNVGIHCQGTDAHSNYNN